MTDSNKGNLAIADLVIYALLFFPTVWITWKHGKTGMVCWPIFLSYFGLRFTSDSYIITHRYEPEIPNTVAIMTNAGSLACLTLTLIGMIYEVNILLPLPPRRWKEKIILGITHLANTGGIALATYGGSPDPDKPDGVASKNLNRIGNCLMLFVLFAVCWWAWVTSRKMTALQSTPNHLYARRLLLAACAGLPFQLVRVGYNLTYALNRIPSLDPITGTFATRLILMFGMQLAVALAAVAGGWFSVGIARKTVIWEDTDLEVARMNSR